MLLPQRFGQCCCVHSLQISERLNENLGSLFDLKTRASSEEAKSPWPSCFEYDLKCQDCTPLMRNMVIANSLIYVIPKMIFSGWPLPLVDQCKLERFWEKMPMFAAPFNPLNVTFCYESHTGHFLPNLWFLYCLIVIQLITLQWMNKTAIIH